MSKTIRYGISGLVIAAAIGGGALWYINHKANIVAGELLIEAEAFVEKNMDGFSLSYGDVSANGLTRSLTISDVTLASADGNSITMDEITLSGDDDFIRVIDASHIRITEYGDSVATVGKLEIRDAEVIKTDIRALAGDPMRMAQALAVDRITLWDTEMVKDSDSISFGKLELTDIKDASMGVSFENLTVESYGDSLSASMVEADRIDIIPLLIWDEASMIRDQFGLSKFEIKDLTIRMAGADLETKLIAISDVKRDRGMLTSINIVIDDMVTTPDMMTSPEIKAIMMMTGVDRITMDMLMSYEVSLEKETFTMNYEMDVEELGKLNISGLVAGLDENTYEVILANATGGMPQTSLINNQLELDHFDLIYTDDQLADIVLDAYSGGNRDAFAEQISSMILFYGTLSQQLDFVQPLAVATSDFIRGGNRFAISLKTRKPLNQDTAVGAITDGNISDIITMTASGS
jgi:hypothetical protein